MKKEGKQEWFCPVKLECDIFYKIIKKKEVNRLAAALGLSANENKGVQDAFYGYYNTVAALEEANILTIDMLRLWQEFAITKILCNAFDKFPVPQLYYCVIHNSYYKRLVSILNSVIKDEQFHGIKFFKKYIQRIKSVFFRNILKIHHQIEPMLFIKPIRISFAPEESRLFKKIHQPLKSNLSKSNTVNLQNSRFHGNIVSENINRNNKQGGQK